MIELTNVEGQVEGWHVRSAFEAKMIGRAAVLHDPNQATNLIIHHNGVKDAAISETQFFYRDYKFGRLVVGKAVARNAEEAFRSVVSSGQAWNGIEPEVAEVFVKVIDAGRQPRLADQIPEPVEDIQATRNVRQAA